MDVARLTEMNTMLKEELRRQERSSEREKQMQNLEYMKNVIFKVSSIKLFLLNYVLGARILSKNLNEHSTVFNDKQCG